jgi:5-methylcytosine-specific restriction protein A
MTIARRSIGKAERARIFLKAGGRCHCCGGRIERGEAWEAEHRLPLWKGGDDTEDNLSPAHEICHAPKTKREASERAKELRRGKPKKEGRPIPGSKRSGFKVRLTSTGPKPERR